MLMLFAIYNVVAYVPTALCVLVAILGTLRSEKDRASVWSGSVRTNGRVGHTKTRNYEGGAI